MVLMDMLWHGHTLQGVTPSSSCSEKEAESGLRLKARSFLPEDTNAINGLIKQAGIDTFCYGIKKRVSDVKVPGIIRMIGGWLVH